MTSHFPCPNSECTYQFDAGILPPAAMVTCPLCRTKFPYRANRPVPTHIETQPTAAEEPKQIGPRVVNIREVPHAGGPWVVVAWCGGGALVLGTLIAVLVMWSKKPTGLVRTSEGQERVDERFNIRLEPFSAGWDEDSAARDAVEANIIGIKRSEPNGWAAMVARDFKDRDPRAAELDDLMIDRSQKLVRAKAVPLEGQTWIGQPARAIQFAGDWDGVQVRGEAHAVAFKGIGYVFFTWAAEKDWDGLQGELRGLRDKFKPLRARTDFTSSVPASVTFSPEGASYQIEDLDGAWKHAKPADQWKTKQSDPKYVLDDPKEIDANAKMVLYADYKSAQGGDSKRKAIFAEAVLAEIDKSGDPMEVARSHISGRIEREFAGAKVAIKLESVTQGPSAPGGAAIAKYRFQSPLDKTDRSYWVVSAISHGGKVIAIEIRTKEEHRSYVEEWMVRLASSLRAK